MLVWKKEIWSNGKDNKQGSWAYRYENDSFLIYLDNGERFTVRGDEPDFGNYKRIKDDTK
jgi:hypothetical protein